MDATPARRMERVHAYSVDRATMQAHVGNVNPARCYLKGADDDVSEAHPKIYAQLLGSRVIFFDQGQKEMATEDVPEYIRRDLLANPLRRGDQAVEQVIKICPHCPEGANVFQSNGFDAHLLEHISALEAKNATPPAGKKKG